MFDFPATFQAHDGGVVAIELSHVIGAAPQLITIGADKTLAIWDTISFKVLIISSCILFLGIWNRLSIVPQYNTPSS